ncbi:MAG: hypothetical protein WC714_28450 [Candidatus Obscuribacterales bacterium]
MIPETHRASAFIARSLPEQIGDGATLIVQAGGAVKMNSVVIGIDPGKTTGIAICHNGKLINVFDSDFWGCISTLKAYESATVVIELPTTKHVWHNDAVNKSSVQRTGVNVGSCIREAELLVKWLSLNERNYIIQRPQGKKTAEQFAKITGWTKRTNQHQRDAGLLCVGLTAKQSEKWLINEH